MESVSQSELKARLCIDRNLYVFLIDFYRSLKCNGRSDCRDGSDELKCPNACQSDNEYECSDDLCIPSNWLCGNKLYLVSFTHIQYCNYLTISKHFLDGRPDCPNDSDELYCTWNDALVQYIIDYLYVIIAVIAVIIVLTILVICIMRRIYRKTSRLH